MRHPRVHDLRAERLVREEPDERCEHLRDDVVRHHHRVGQRAANRSGARSFVRHGLRDGRESVGRPAFGLRPAGGDATVTLSNLDAGDYTVIVAATSAAGGRFGLSAQ